MIPTYREGSLVLVNRLSYLFHSPQILDIVVLHDPRNGGMVLKRIIKIKDSAYFVEGDNKKASTDSREFGAIPQQLIIGKVIYQLE